MQWTTVVGALLFVVAVVHTQDVTPIPPIEVNDNIAIDNVNDEIGTLANMPLIEERHGKGHGKGKGHGGGKD